MSTQHTIPDIDPKGLRQFAFTMGIIISLLFGLILPFIFDYSLPKWPWIVALVFVIWGLVAPKTIKPIYQIWMRFGLIMSKITTPIILGILFFLIMTPMGIVMRMFRHDPMARKFDKTKDTYRVMRDQSINSDIEKPY